MRILETFALAGLVLCVSGAATAAVETAEVEGYAAIVNGDQAAARDRALDDAKRKAVEQVAGVQISSESMTESFQLVEDKIYADIVPMPASGEQGVMSQRASFGTGEDQASDMAEYAVVWMKTWCHQGGRPPDGHRARGHRGPHLRRAQAHREHRGGSTSARPQAEGLRPQH